MPPKNRPPNLEKPLTDVRNDRGTAVAARRKDSAALDAIGAGLRRIQTKVAVETMLSEGVRDRSGKPGAKRGLGTQSSEAKIATEGRNDVADRRSPDPKGDAQINDFVKDLCK